MKFKIIIKILFVVLIAVLLAANVTANDDECKDECIVIGNGTGTHALHTNGSEIWSNTDGDGISHVAIYDDIVVSSDGERVNNDQDIRAINKTTGQLLWSANPSGPCCADSLDIHGNYTTMGTYDDTSNDNIYSYNSKTGNLLWTGTAGDHAEALNYGDNGTYIYTGSDTHLQERYAENGTINNSVSIGGDAEVLVAKNNTVYVQNANKEIEAFYKNNLTKKWGNGQLTISNGDAQEMVVSKKYLYFWSDSDIGKIYINNGTLKTTIQIGIGALGNGLDNNLNNKFIYASSSNDGSLIKFYESNGTTKWKKSDVIYDVKYFNKNEFIDSNDNTKTVESGELSIRTSPFMSHNDSQEYVVRFNDSTVTENATVTSSNSTIITVDSNQLTLNSTKNENITGEVQIKAEYKGETVTTNVSVATITIKDIDLLSPLYSTLALATNEELIYLFIVVLIGTSAAIIVGCYGGIGSVILLLSLGWIAEWSSLGLLFIGLFGGMFIIITNGGSESNEEI